MTAAVLERPRRAEFDRFDDDVFVTHRPAPKQRTRAGTVRTPSGRPKLKVIDQEAARRRARRRNGLLVLFVVVLLGFFGVAFAQAQLVADQQSLDVLRAQIAEAETRNAQLSRQVEQASAPAVVVERARELGMVGAHEPVYLVASSPLPEIPQTPTIEAAPATFDLAAPQAVTASTIQPGISSQADVAASETPAEAPVADASVVDAPVVVPEPATPPVVVTSPEPEAVVPPDPTPLPEPATGDVLPPTSPATESSLGGSTVSVGGTGAGSLAGTTAATGGVQNG